jgi:hypothetical protein
MDTLNPCCEKELIEGGGSRSSQYQAACWAAQCEFRFSGIGLRLLDSGPRSKSWKPVMANSVSQWHNEEMLDEQGRKTCLETKGRLQETE